MQERAALRAASSRGLLLASLLLATAAAAVDTTRTSVALTLVGFDETDYARLQLVELEKQSVVRLVQEGFAVVTVAAHPDVLLVLANERGALWVRAGDVARLVPAKGLTRQELHLAVTHKLVELAREAEAALPPRPALAAQVTPAPSVPASPLSEEPRWSLGAGLGGLYRSGGADLLTSVRASRRLGRTRLELSTGFVRSTSLPLRLFEVELLGGVSVEHPLGEDFTARAGLSAGVLLHHFELEPGSTSTPSGNRWDGLLCAPLVLAWRGLAPFEFGLSLAPGVAGRTRSHQLDGQTLWSRGAVRLAGGLFASWTH